MVNQERLKHTFLDLIKLSSPSYKEGLVAGYIRERLIALGIVCLEDKAGEVLSGTTGNLIGWMEGEIEPTIMLNAHMDTVQRPDEEIEVIEENGIFKSSGKTVLGADDKSGIAIILEVLEVLKERKLSHYSLQPVFTICEEIGLLGAKNLDYSAIKAKWGLVLDGGNPLEIIHRAPTANRFYVEVIGKEAHAGVHPEQGINAIALASKAISQIEWGRIDGETTCNVGLIQGGIATNIVPPKVAIEGEVRSHNKEKLEIVTKKIISAFEKTIAQTPPKAELPKLNIDIKIDYPLMYVAQDHPLINLLKQAGKKLGMELVLKKSGGGSDANIFNERGIVSVILGTGMKDVHTRKESISLQDMIKTATLLIEILTTRVK
ncbi:MAG TPA: M20/M25/M40 family metallo-hydrolase [Candidatus Desulfofervidus auxilii]|uniref:M20/M25/M40 family metallo-hydrolase n=1 Tax=Desulfofervidus auxilii TaxID=1621989 RepID=A0A7V0IAI8_DESA2|nr:M20/M25/M40 family metallo-hydrolase [Candidatus Desulfofervidus auxilii]